METREATAAFAALAQETRLAVFRLLVRQGPNGLPAGDIAELVGAAPSATRAESWRKNLSAREIEIFELGAGALLDTLGYARDYPFPRVATRSEKIRMGEWPVRISMQPMTKWKLARRWSKVEAPKKGQWT